MPILRKYRVFVSHAWDYTEDYGRVVQFLRDEPNFEFENLSVPQHDPLKDPRLAYHLHKRMRDSEIFLIIGGMYVAHHDWIEYELNFSWRIGLPVIGIRKWGSERIPESIQRASRGAIVGWNGYSIVSAIREHARVIKPKVMPQPQRNSLLDPIPLSQIGTKANVLPPPAQPPTLSLAELMRPWSPAAPRNTLLGSSPLGLLGSPPGLLRSTPPTGLLGQSLPVTMRTLLGDAEMQSAEQRARLDVLFRKLGL